jgi:3-oxoacyl-[acyl-carrier-protein] synthase-1
MSLLSISRYTLTSAAGAGIDRNWAALRDGVTGLAPCRFDHATDLNTWTGEVDGIDDHRLPARFRDFECRNNRLALLGLEQDGFFEAACAAVNHYGADRVGVFMGTSTSGILDTETAYLEPGELDSLPGWYNYRGSQNIFSLADFIRQCIGASGPCAGVSTACSSSAKVFASAYRAMRAGFCDAAVVGGVDSLCMTTLYGFNALQLLADDICRPADIERRGLSIGEAAGYALVEWPDRADGPGLLGYGESSDAYHMSSPQPEGDGAFLAMNDALARAGLGAGQIDYINLHGTGTAANDLAESRAVERLFDNPVPCSSSKGWIGHTLGAAGIAEAVYSLLCIRNDYVLPSLNTRTVDPGIRINIQREGHARPVRRVLSNSFGFGGSNCCLIFGAPA